MFTGKNNRGLLQIGKFYPPHKGGMERHLKDLCEGLAGNIPLNVLVANKNIETCFEKINGVPILRAGRIKEISSNSLCPTLPFWARSFHPGIIHIHLPNPMAHLAYLFCEKKNRLVITWHSDIIRQKRMLRYYHPFLLKLLERADKIIATSDNYRRHSPYLSRFSGKTRTIPLGIDVTAFEMTTEVRNNTRNINRLYGTGPFILFVGRLSSYKGLTLLIKATEKIPAKLLIVGEGPEREVAYTLVKKLNLKSRVFFCGDIPDKLIPAYYNACTVFVLPSTERSEAFGIVQLEAMACGKPVVSTNIKSGVPYVNLHKKTGIVVEPGSPDALAIAINTLLEKEEMRKAYGAFGRERVLKEFTREKMVKSTLGIYKEFL